MSLRRISLGLSAFAAIVVSVMGSPLASADIVSLGVSMNTSDQGQGQIFNDWKATATVTPCSTAPIYFTDNGKPMPGSPVAVDCTYSVTAYPSIDFRPKTLGAHHVVATQLNSDGSVASSYARDVDVKCLPALGNNNGCLGGTGSIDRLIPGSSGS